jgi:osmoprotectant transport system substrate-binding protein
VQRRPGSRWTVALPVLLAAMLLAAASCRSGPGSTGVGAPARSDAVVVASFNFAESGMIGDIYARALRGAGIPVRQEADLGTREMVEPALRQGLVDVVPEYAGSALAGLEPVTSVNVTDTGAAVAGLAGALAPWRLRVLEPAPAENQNGLVVTRELADRLSLHTTSDLARVAPGLTLGGPAECPRRPYCLEGFQRVYGLHFARFSAFDSEDQRVTALNEHVIDVAVMFTTDAHLATGDLVLLIDDRRLQPADNIVPVVSGRVVARYGARLVDTLDAVSSRLTSQTLLFLNWRVALDGKDAASEAQGWLERQGLVPRT